MPQVTQPPAVDSPMENVNIPQTNTLASKVAVVVTPSDTAAIPLNSARGLYIGVSGDVKVDMVAGGTGIVFKSVPVGKLEIVVSKVYATGTTATNIVALI